MEKLDLIDVEESSGLSSLEMIQRLSFCVFDLETTGGDTKLDKIIEIGMVKIERGEIVGRKQFLIRPEIKIPDFIQKLTTIHPQDVKNAPIIDEVIDEILEFMGDSILVAHNASFDIPFFNSVLVRLGRPPLANKTICTNLMTKYMIPGLLNSNLNYMSKIFGIEHQKAHRAMDDAQAAALLLLKYLDIFVDKGIKKINHLYYPRNRYELDRKTVRRTDPDSAKELERMINMVPSPFLFSLKGEEGLLLFALPGKGTQIEREYILSQVKKFNWVTASLRLFGHFFEALTNFNEFAIKMDNGFRGDVFDFLRSNHMPGLNFPQVLDDPANYPDAIGDFVVMNHLIPEQYVIYPLWSLYPPSSLIFRFPGHQKKLTQYIKTRSQKGANDKSKKVFTSPELKRFSLFYLWFEKQKHKSDILFFKKNVPLKKKDEFVVLFDEFINSAGPLFDYPRKYL